MGHTGVHLESSYFRGGEDKHEEEYMKAVPYLNILAPQTEDYTALVEKVKFLEENGKRKETEIQKLCTQALENVELKKRIGMQATENVELKRRMEQTEGKLADIESKFPKLEKLIREALEQK